MGKLNFSNFVHYDGLALTFRIISDARPNPQPLELIEREI